MKRSDYDGSVVLLEKLTSELGEVAITSQANDNSRFRIDLKGAGPFEPGDELGLFALVVDNSCVMLGSHSDPDDNRKMNFAGWQIEHTAAEKMAAKLAVTPALRRHPGHKMDVRFSPAKPTFSPGDPVIVTMTIKNVGDKPFSFMDGGQQRGPRNNQFGFTAFRDAGKGEEVPDTGDATNFGGTAGVVTLKPGEAFEKEVDITKWFDLSDPDTYLIRGHFEMVINGSWDRIATGTTIVTVAAEEGASETAIPESVRAVLKAMKQDVLKLAEKFPQLGAAATVEVKPDGWLFEHDCRYMGKRGYRNTGLFPLAIGLKLMTTEAFDEQVQKAAMRSPDFRWKNLELVGWTTLYRGAKLPEAFVPEIQAVMQKTLNIIQALDNNVKPDATQQSTSSAAEASMIRMEGDVTLNRDLAVGLRGAAGDRSGIFTIHTVRFEEKKGRLSATLKGSLISWPKGEWTVAVTLLNKKITNTGGEPRTVLWHPLHYSPIVFSFMQPGGVEHIRADIRRSIINRLPAPPETLTLQPGDSREVTVDLKHYMEGMRPGTYVIAGYYWPKAKQASIPGEFLNTPQLKNAVMERIGSTVCELVVRRESRTAEEEKREVERLEREAKETAV